MKTLVTEGEAVCMSWIALRTTGDELPRGSNPGVFGKLIAGGALDADAMKVVAAAHRVWARRGGWPNASTSAGRPRNR